MPAARKSPKKPRPRKGPAGATSAAKRGVVAGSADDAVVTTGDGNKVTVNHFHGAPVRSSAALRQAYLHHVLRTAGRLSLSGVDPKAAGRENQAIELHAVYTALLTVGLDVDERAPRERGGVRERVVRALSAVEQLDRHPHLVLLGEPGGGKSTFLNFVAMCLAGEGLADKRVNLRALTTPSRATATSREAEAEAPALAPRLARARCASYCATSPPAVCPRPGSRPAPSTSGTSSSRELGAATLGDFAGEPRAQLQEDGRPRAPRRARRGARGRPPPRADQAGRRRTSPRVTPSCRILVTSRTYAYQKQDWKLIGFAEAVLAPFGQAQRDAVRRSLVRPSRARIRGMSQDDSRGGAELLKHAVESSDRLQALAERPLLLTLMATFTRGAAGACPRAGKSCTPTRWICSSTGGRAQGGARRARQDGGGAAEPRRVVEGRQ